MPEAQARFRFWPRSLQGQMLLAIALALMVAQGLSAALMWRMQHERHFAGMVNYAAFSLLGRNSRGQFRPPPPLPGEGPEIGFRMPRPLRVQEEARAPQLAGDRRRPEIEQALRQVLEAQGVDAARLFVAERDPARDPVLTQWLARRGTHMARPPGAPRPRLIIAAIGRPDGTWLTARLLAPRNESAMLTTLVLQTLFIYLVLDKTRANLGMARYQLTQIEKDLTGIFRVPGGGVLPLDEDARVMTGALEQSNVAHAGPDHPLAQPPHPNC